MGRVKDKRREHRFAAIVGGLLGLVAALIMHIVFFVGDTIPSPVEIAMLYLVCFSLGGLGGFLFSASKLRQSAGPARGRGKTKGTGKKTSQRRTKKTARKRKKAS